MQTPGRKSVHQLWTRELSVNCVNGVYIANAKSRVNIGDRLRDCRTENIHTRNTLVIDFRLAMLGLAYGIPSFSILSTVTL